MTARTATAAGCLLVLLAGCDPPTASPTAAVPTSVGTGTQAAGPRGDTASVVVQRPVVDVVDGDTLALADGSRVRLAIVDTPEVHGHVEPCGREASAFTAASVDGQDVAVYRPSSGPRTDGYGRTLGEVVRLSDGASLNVALVAAGLARVDDRFTDEDADLAARLG